MIKTQLRIKEEKKRANVVVHEKNKTEKCVIGRKKGLETEEKEKT